MFRVIAWALLVLYLLIVGAFPAAVAPVSLAFTGLGFVGAAIPGWVLLLAAAAVWRKFQPTPKPATA
ncbi:MAG TPA: hypothetical protein VGE61_09685 [Glycomyces sp.]